MPHSVNLTEYSHGSGCGCKIAPAVLDRILQSDIPQAIDPALLVGNASRDDAAVYDLGNGSAVISTTDFFMPIVDDPFDFGRIAATNAISDIYAMGGKPLMAIAIFGWPLDRLPPEVGRRVVEGGRHVCQQAGIPLAGGHSIDAPEPIFGLAVTGSVELAHLKRNDQARPGDRIYLTKPLGIGILTTALKKKLLKPEQGSIATETMCRLNDIGHALGRLSGVNAMTDVTGFGLAGHLREICEGSGVDAEIVFDRIPVLPDVAEYLDKGCSPGGARRNFESYGHLLNPMPESRWQLVCDPQTSGGLLVTVAPESEPEFLELSRSAGLSLTPLGVIREATDGPLIEVK